MDRKEYDIWSYILHDSDSKDKKGIDLSIEFKFRKLDCYYRKHYSILIKLLQFFINKSYVTANAHVSM